MDGDCAAMNRAAMLAVAAALAAVQAVGIVFYVGG